MLSELLHEEGQNCNLYLNKVQFNRSIKNTLSNLLFGINQRGDTQDFRRMILESDNQEKNRDFKNIKPSAQDSNLDS